MSRWWCATPRPSPRSAPARDPSDDDEVVATTVGRPVPGVELEIVGDDGEPVAPPARWARVRLRSAAVLRGYVGDLAAGRAASTPRPPPRCSTTRAGSPPATSAAVGDDGNLRLVGRVSEMYIRGGYNVYPAEVEAVLGELPGVAQVAVVGAPDPVLGEIGAAFVVPAAGVGAPDARRAPGRVPGAAGRLQGPRPALPRGGAAGDPDGEDRQARAGGARRRARDHGEVKERVST